MKDSNEIKMSFIIHDQLILNLDEVSVNIVYQILMGFN